VETPATIDTLNPVAPIYPDSMLRASVAGRVLVEFVVDAAGVPEMPTFAVVLSTHAMFTEAVRRAVASARFIPAVRDGKAVRQRVQLPLAFAVPRTE
jgi:protein TonB